MHKVTGIIGVLYAKRNITASLELRSLKMLSAIFGEVSVRFYKNWMKNIVFTLHLGLEPIFLSISLDSFFRFFP